MSSETSAILPRNNNNNNNNQNDDSTDPSFPSQSQLSCPVDLSCMWTGPKWALTAWVSSAAGFLGLNPTNETDIIHNGTGRNNSNAGRSRTSAPNSARTRYVPLTTSTDSIASADGSHLDDDAQNTSNVDDDEENINSQKQHRNKDSKNNGDDKTIIAQINSDVFNA